MKLFLISEDSHPETLKKLENYNGSLEDKRIICIPTAANGHEYGSWKNWDTPKILKNSGASVEFIELERCSKENVIKLIGNPDILWVLGGMAGYLSYWMRRSGLEEKLPTLLKQGTMYLGSSGGSMVTSNTLYSSEWYIGEEEKGASVLPGLGLVDFEIYPHYNESLLPQIESHWNKGKIYLIKDGEVIVVEDNQVKVLGEERILEK